MSGESKPASSSHIPPVRVAGCVLRNPEGSILLLHRKKRGQAQWELPGGKVELGEKLDEAAMREIAEELGVYACNLVFLGGVSLANDQGRQYEFTWFLAECREGHVPRIAEPEVFDDLRYFSLAELSELALRGEQLSLNMQALVSQIQSKQVTIT